MNPVIHIKDLPLIPKGFNYIKGDENYWTDIVRDFWADTGLNTDITDVGIIVTYFDKLRELKNINK